MRVEQDDFGDFAFGLVQLVEAALDLFQEVSHAVHGVCPWVGKTAGCGSSRLFARSSIVLSARLTYHLSVTLVCNVVVFTTLSLENRM
ncbi:hypothetical protein D3C76_1519850 [compost metagenome]